MNAFLSVLVQIVPLLQTLLWIATFVGVALCLRPEIRLLRRSVADRIAKGSSFRFGPVEIGELSDRVEFIAGTQRDQYKQLKTLQFLISHMLTGYELDHLRKLASENAFSFTRSDSFDEELGRLRNLGFIEHCPGTPWGIRQLPHSGSDLRTLLRPTSRGQEYLKLRLDYENIEEVARPE